ncbi:MAG: type 1 glutamine amidotransferase [Methanolinea sp.]|jgi:GMP synthase-like glutamine amidotransferase|nr:type 1 glutamine amidotransferase [Methanolinea sp.]
MIAICQHGDEESAGCLEEILNEKGVSFRVHPLHETNEIPAGERSHTILLGGSMSVNDEEEYPFLHAEKEQIRLLIARRSPVLGICLGAQLIAAALGSRVYPGAREVGWCMVSRAGGSIPFTLPWQFPVFQWHQETFDLPEGARLVCRGDRVENQFFTCGSGTGVQFHMEITPSLVQRWSGTLPAEVQDILMRETDLFIEKSRDICGEITGAFLARGSGS